MGPEEVGVQGPSRHVIGALGPKEPVKQSAPSPAPGQKQNRDAGQVGVLFHAVEQGESFRHIAVHHHQKRVLFPGKFHPFHQLGMVLYKDAAPLGVALDELRGLELLVHDKHNAGLSVHQVLRPLKRLKIPFPGVSVCSSRKRVAHS